MEMSAYAILFGPPKEQKPSFKITQEQAARAHQAFGLNENIVSIETFRTALNIELEHGTKYGNVTNVTRNCLTKTAMIAIAHLIEFPNYYEHLVEMESKLEQYWSGKEKPSIFK